MCPPPWNCSRSPEGEGKGTGWFASWKRVGEAGKPQQTARTAHRLEGGPYRQGRSVSPKHAATATTTTRIAPLKREGGKVASADLMISPSPASRRSSVVAVVRKARTTHTSLNTWENRFNIRRKQRTGLIRLRFRVPAPSHTVRHVPRPLRAVAVAVSSLRGVSPGAVVDGA